MDGVRQRSGKVFTNAVARLKTTVGDKFPNPWVDRVGKVLTECCGVTKASLDAWAPTANAWVYEQNYNEHQT